QTAQTDAAGAYRIEGLMPGRYVVAVQTPSAPFQPLPLQPVKRARPPRSLGYAPMFYPESPGAGTAEAILVAAGSERAEVDFRLKVTPVLRVPVVVTGARAGELVLVRLTPLDRWNGPNFESAQGADSGAATLENVPPGTYRLTAETAGDPSACRVASVPLVVSDRPLPRVELRLEGGPSVTIQIRDAEGRPAKAQFRLEPLGDEAMTLPVFDEQAQPPAMKCLTAGVWAVRLFDRMQVVKAVQVGPETVRGDVFRVEAALPPSLVFVVGPASARIVARVDGTTDRALIVALRETAQGLAPPVVWLSGDPPPPLGAGRYRLAAVPSTIPANEWLLELLEGFLETVELQDGEEKQATLKFLSMDQIHKALER
ncbi:MAG TPA: hypothetical protein DEH78_25535, partial [Solibacterales bacterium]|nr:hypothetical protein [Bryobacterales bacterium]